MKPVFNYLLAICIFLLIGNNQLFARTTAQSAFPSLVESQQIWGNSDNEINGLEQNFNTKSLLPTSVEIPREEVSEFEAEKKHATYLSYGPLVAHFKSLTSPRFIHNNGLIPFFEKHLSYSSSRRYLLFEVFRL